MLFLRRLFALFRYTSIAYAMSVFVLTVSLSYAQTISFSPEIANQTLDKVSLKLSADQINADVFESSIETLTRLNESAQECYQYTKKEVDELEGKIKELDVSASDGRSTEAEYLLNKKKKMSEKMTQCRLFAIRSEEAIQEYTGTLHQIARSMLLRKTDSIWTRFANHTQMTEAFHSIGSWELGVSLLQKWYWFVLLILGYVSYGWLLRWTLKHPEKMYFHQASNLDRFKPEFLFRMRVVGLVSFLSGVIYVLFAYASEPVVINELIFELMTAIACIVLFWTSLLVRHFVSYRPLYWILVAIFACIFLGAMVLALVGFHNLSTYVVVNIFLTILAAIIVSLVVSLMHKLVGLFEKTDRLWQKKFHHYLGIKPHRSIPEMVILKIVCSIVGVILYVGLLVQFWGWKTIYPDKFISAITDGFTMFKITIEPVQILIAVLVFVALGLVGRYVSAHISRKYQSGEKDMQVALASIVGYVAFVVALLVALLVSGVNFTGLAIIAGALSVGIGLGLQDIVNNFVSGIILLIEKPIRPGDRIVVNDTEGFVKRVRVRATQIVTMSRSDVIVPNADLIKNQVTNYMFRDQHWRISCKVGVAYGSDIDLVKKVLLAVASKHENVIQEGRDAPVVLFKEFGDSTLNFELWCIIKDVNNKFIVQSELNFEIDQAFRAKDIVIAFPQRDVHLFTHTVKDEKENNHYVKNGEIEGNDQLEQIEEKRKNE